VPTKEIYSNETKESLFIPVLLSILFMPLQFIAETAIALLDIAVITLIVAIPAFIVLLPAQKLNTWLKEKFSLSWSAAAFATAFLILLPIVFALYLIPLAIGASLVKAAGTNPEFMQLTMLDYAMAVIATIVKNLLSTLLFTILLMPLVFFASFAREKVEQRFKVHRLAKDFLATFLTTGLAWAILLFVFPWVPTAIIWKLYWSPI